MNKRTIFKHVKMSRNPPAAAAWTAVRPFSVSTCTLGLQPSTWWEKAKEESVTKYQVVLSIIALDVRNILLTKKSKYFTQVFVLDCLVEIARCNT